MKIKLVLLALVICAGIGLAVSQMNAPPVWSINLDGATYKGTLTVPSDVVSVVDCESAVRVQVPIEQIQKLSVRGVHVADESFGKPDYCGGKAVASLVLDIKRSVVTEKTPEFGVVNKVYVNERGIHGSWEGQAVTLTSQDIVFDLSKALGPVSVERVQ